ncbi:MAG: 50S ribosomal protein L20, partial [Clostridia bacterium]|nr:50S ribosomal protein L20 [Clostridia bacterium]
MRIKRGVNANKKRVKIRKLSKGYRGSKSKLYRVAREAVMKSGNYAYVGRKNKKRDMRTLWIARINAAAREYGLSYSKMMHGMKVVSSGITPICVVTMLPPSSNARSTMRLERS